MSSSRSPRPVLVYGAAGHTARFVVAALRRQGHPLLLGGRDAARLRQAFPDAPDAALRAFDLADRDRTRSAVAAAGLVLNCAGPFADTAEPLLEAALAAGAHYLDIGAEQAVARAVLEEWNAKAAEAGVLAVPAVGFWGGLGDLLATAAMGDWTSADEIAVHAFLDSWHPTEGTRRTGRRNAGRQLVFSGGKLQPPLATPVRKTWDFGHGEREMLASSTADIVTIASHLAVQEVPVWISENSIRDLRDPQTPPPAPVDASGRSAQRFTMQVIARRGLQQRQAAASGQDIYAVTGPLVAHAATRVLAGGQRPAGSFSVGALFEAREFLQALAPDPLSLRLD